MQQAEEQKPGSRVTITGNTMIVTPGTMAAAVMIVSPGPDSYSVEYFTFSSHLIPFY